MPAFLTAAAEIFHATGHVTAQRIAKHMENLTDCTFSEKFPPVPSLQHLNATQSQPGALPLVREIIALADHLPWDELDAEIGPSEMVGKHAFCQIAGPDGLFGHDAFRMGVYIQSPDVFYPAHAHTAEEIYVVISGRALWQRGDGPYEEHGPGTMVHHLSDQSHIMHTRDEVLLAIWGWVGDLDFNSYRVL